MEKHDLVLNRYKWKFNDMVSHISKLYYDALPEGHTFSKDEITSTIRTVTSRAELGKLSRPVLGGTDGFVPSCKRIIAPLKQPGTNG